MGRLLFKRWFIDFEFPDKKGKSYRSNGGKMVDSELGKIPEGWRVGNYSELVLLSTGKGLKRDDLIGFGKYKVFGANGVIGKTNNYLFDEKLILTGRVGTLGTIHLVDNKIWISDNVIISKPLLEENYYFSYFTLKSFDLKSLNRGSTQPLITQTDLKKQKIILPRKSILGKFDEISKNIFDKKGINYIQIQSITKLRDTLLPQLMSGKVRVK
jgi:type I restriction enzyme S subunit